MKFSKGKVAALAIAGVVALGGVGGALAWGINSVNPVEGTSQTESAIIIKYEQGTDIDAGVTIDPLGSVRKKVVVKGVKTESLTDVGKITFTYTATEAVGADTVRVRITENSDYSQGETDKILNDAQNIPATYEFALDNAEHSYFLEFTVVGTLTAQDVATIANTPIGKLNIKLGSGVAA